MATKQQTPAAKLKKELKAAFPGLKISCKMDGYAIHISTDLMGSEYKKADLEAIAYNNKKFSYRSDDGETHFVYVDATENEPDSCEIDPNAALDEVEPQQNEVTTESTQEIEVEYESYTHKVGRCQWIGFRKVETVEENTEEININQHAKEREQANEIVPAFEQALRAAQRYIVKATQCGIEIPVWQLEYLINQYSVAEIKCLTEKLEPKQQRTQEDIARLEASLDRLL